MNEYPYFIEEISLNPSCKKSIIRGLYVVSFENYHPTSISILGFKKEDGATELYDLEIPAFSIENVSQQRINLAYKPTHVLYEVQNIPGEVYKMKVPFWNKTDLKLHPRMGLKGSLSNLQKSIGISMDSVITFPSGKYSFSESILFPRGYKVRLEAGCDIDLVNNAALIVQNDLYAEGTANNSVKVYSSDSTGQGLIVLSADSVLLNHIEVNNLQNLNYNDWVLTGALTVYDSKIYGEKISSLSNNSEDAVNFVNSELYIDSLFIANTFSDAFDADFCSGYIAYVNVSFAGNDAVDCSGSVIQFGNIVANKVGDKGISAGEGSTLTVNETQISNAVFGLVSKDKSDLIVNLAEVKNTEIGAAAFQKKPEFGASNISIKNYNFKKVGQLLSIEAGSFIIVEGSYINGWENNMSEEIYSETPIK